MGAAAHSTAAHAQHDGAQVAGACNMDAVLSVDMAAAVPVKDSREVWGRKVVRLDAGSGCTHSMRCSYSSARAA